MTPHDSQAIDRREAIRRVGALVGGVTLAGGSRLFAAAERATAETRRTVTQAGVGDFTARDVAFLDEIAETILPETSTPGAKAAQVGAFMALMVTDTYEPRDQQIFRRGMQQVDDACRSAHGAGFMDATPAQRLPVLEALDREQKAYSDRVEAAERRTKGLEAKPDTLPPPPPGTPPITDDSPRHFFRMMKDLALLGYFTSEIGYTKAMRYVEAPGRYDPCVPYTKGETIWASHA